MAPADADGEYLDDTPSGTVRMSVTEAYDLGEGALQRIGFSQEDARIIMGQLIDNALCGYPFTSLPRILAIASDPKTQQPRKPVSIVHETLVSAMLDGGNNVGYVAVYKTAEVAIEKARTNGFSIVGAYDSYYSGRNAYYVEKIVKEGFVTIHTACGQPHVVPPGGAQPALGTNPFCIGFPSANGPIIVDSGTAALQWGEVMLHARLDTTLPEGVGVDESGMPTRDAKDALRGGVLPFGGHKGYGLSLAIQTMGLLAGAAIPRGNVQDYGFLFITFDPGLLIPPDQFNDQVAALMDAIRATPRKPGVDEIRIPSERAFNERNRRRREGIVVAKKVVDALNAL
ncbi:MAG: Ldh family oxidoreductase [Alphaproteobacteria bacterium]|nr:Ldh family oxidoreductase [Alphaproteobacteria bacterium]